MCLGRVFLLFWLSWNFGCLPSAVAQKSLNDPSHALPEVQAALVTRERQPGDTGSETLHIAVQIPPNHHGYLDTGDEGFFIPLSFAFPSLEEQGAQVVMVSHPIGERDEAVHATVLRGGRPPNPDGALPRRLLRHPPAVAALCAPAEGPLEHGRGGPRDSRPPNVGTDHGPGAAGGRAESAVLVQGHGRDRR